MVRTIPFSCPGRFVVLLDNMGLSLYTKSRKQLGGMKRMYHKIKSVKALENMKLSVVFQDGTEKAYNIRTRYSVFPQF